jgi:NAD(P)H-dependent flavin oxidoreductase YrpB (nitropropane dioxygenase family)
MPLRTRLTERLGVEHPIISAPMGTFAGGRLAAAVSSAGGLGLIGGGYGDGDWIDRRIRQVVTGKSAAIPGASMKPPAVPLAVTRILCSQDQGSRSPSGSRPNMASSNAWRSACSTSD